MAAAFPAQPTGDAKVTRFLCAAPLRLARRRPALLKCPGLHI